MDVEVSDIMEQEIRNHVYGHFTEPVGEMDNLVEAYMYVCGNDDCCKVLVPSLFYDS